MTHTCGDCKHFRYGTAFDPDYCDLDGEATHPGIGICGRFERLYPLVDFKFLRNEKKNRIV